MILVTTPNTKLSEHYSLLHSVLSTYSLQATVCPFDPQMPCIAVFPRGPKKNKLVDVYLVDAPLLIMHVLFIQHLV